MTDIRYGPVRRIRDECDCGRPKGGWNDGKAFIRHTDFCASRALVAYEADVLERCPQANGLAHAKNPSDPAYGTCTMCADSPVPGWVPKVCERCKGSGEKVVQTATFPRGGATTACAKCHGTGILIQRMTRERYREIVLEVLQWFVGDRNLYKVADISEAERKFALYICEVIASKEKL